MSPLMDPRNYAHVPVLLWPLVFLRLWVLFRWADAEGLQVLYTVRSTGQVVVRYVSDDRSSLNAWLRARSPSPPLHHDAMGDVPFGVSLIPVAMGAAVMRFGARIIYIARKSQKPTGLAERAPVGRGPPLICARR